MDKFDVIIIGAGPGGLKTAMRLRRLDFGQKILVIDKGSFPSFGACGMPFYIEGLVKNFDDLRKKLGNFGNVNKDIRNILDDCYKIIYNDYNNSIFTGQELYSITEILSYSANVNTSAAEKISIEVINRL